MTTIISMIKGSVHCGFAAVILAGLLTSCSSDDSITEQPVNTDDAIVLDVEGVASPVSRATQVPGVQTFETLKVAGKGFGVYGYKGVYNSASSTPTLFADDATNTHVTFIPGGTNPTSVLVHPGSWTYAATAADLREWKKNGANEEKYTFFAYAPYMASNGTAPGITTIKASSDVTAGDPTVGYQVATNPAESVDLLWGIRSDNGLPWKDIQRGQTAGAVMFTFYHALCAIGYHAQVIVDKDNNLTDPKDQSNMGKIGTDCKVTIKSITLEPNNANSKPGLFYQTGVLNLNNSTPWTPSWGSLSGSIASFVLSGSQIDAAMKDPQLNDTPLTTEQITSFMSNASNPGVTESANTQTVIAKNAGKEQFYMLLPYAAKDYKLTVKYFITYKTGDATYFRSDEFTGTALLNNLELKPGIKYYFNMVFSLTTFKLSVLAEDWDGRTINTSVVVENGTSASQSLAKELSITE
jgi:hypothetical protein